MFKFFVIPTKCQPAMEGLVLVCLFAEEIIILEVALGAQRSETLFERFNKENKSKNLSIEVNVLDIFASLPWRVGRWSIICAHVSSPMASYPHWESTDRNTYLI